MFSTPFPKLFDIQIKHAEWQELQCKKIKLYFKPFANGVDRKHSLSPW